MRPRFCRGLTAEGSFLADVAQLVEHSLGKGEVTSSILVIGSMSLEVEAEGSGKGTTLVVPLRAQGERL